MTLYTPSCSTAPGRRFWSIGKHSDTFQVIFQDTFQTTHRVRKARRSRRLRNLKKKLTKKEEYPKIDWRDLEDPSVQKAELIYSDRINLHRDLLRLDRDLDGAPTPEKIAELVEKSIRSRLCFDELRSFNSTGRFLGRHPFVRTDDGMSRLRQLLLTSPEDFMKEYRRAAMNVSRYGTRLRRDGLSEELQEKYRQLLDKWTEREKMMGECLKMNLYATEKRI